MRKEYTLDQAIVEIREMLNEYEVTAKDRTRLERTFETHRSMKKIYESDEWSAQAKMLHEYIQMSTHEVERRMELSEQELWTPFTI